VIPAISEIKKNFPDTLLSVDTFRSQVAKAAVEAGAELVNDISAGNFDPEMLPLVAQLGVPYIAMHMKGTPQTMQGLAHYEHLIPEILEYFIERISHLEAAGIKDIILDPGFGFAKTIEQSFLLLAGLENLKILQKPVLAGLSRKSMIYKTLKTTPEASLNGTTALNTIALTKGANILRVHDVKEAAECIKLTSQLQSSS
jgi:dihydropteroate synthase